MVSWKGRPNEESKEVSGSEKKGTNLRERKGKGNNTKRKDAKEMKIGTEKDINK